MPTNKDVIAKLQSTNVTKKHNLQRLSFHLKTPNVTACIVELANIFIEFIRDLWLEPSQFALADNLKQSFRTHSTCSRYLRSKTSLLRAVEMLLALHECARLLYIITKTYIHVFTRGRQGCSLNIGSNLNRRKKKKLEPPKREAYITKQDRGCFACPYLRLLRLIQCECSQERLRTVHI